MNYFSNLTFRAINNLHCLILIFILPFYLILAYKSSGYYQPDEHYQIIEFANYKLGLIHSEKLAWEFQAGIRSGLQPFICYLIFLFLRFAGITDGYDLTFILRAFTAVMSICIIKHFIANASILIKTESKPYFILLTYLLWFLPIIYIRFTSENYSGLFLLLTLTHLFKFEKEQKSKSLIGMGILIGISILFRYQSAIFAASIFLYLLVVQRTKIKFLSLFLISIFLVLALGVLLDYWLYGKWVLSIYNYFNVNILQGVASTYGTAPFLTYFHYILQFAKPFGLLIILSLFTVSILQIRNPLVWVVLPFLIIHSFISHKELRFLFPIAHLTPLFLILSLEMVSKLLLRLRFINELKILTAVALICLIFLNITGLYAITLAGIGLRKTMVTEFIHRNYDEKKTNIILLGNVNPYMDWGPPLNTYYASSGLTIDHIESVYQTDLFQHKKNGFKNIVVANLNDIEGVKTFEYMRQIGFKKVYQNIPSSVAKIFRIYNPSINNQTIAVYEFD